MRPRIGVTMSFNTSTEVDPPRDRAALYASYIDAVLAAGGLPCPVPVLPAAQLDLIPDILAGLDGVLFTGGDDLNPQHYGQESHACSGLMHPRRDAFELPFFRAADEARVPILAICLGFQLAHVARGGSLYQHVDDLQLTPRVTHHLPHDKSAYHPVRVAPTSTLRTVLGTGGLETNSRHHQVVDPEHLGTGLTPVAWAPDGIVEAAEDMDNRWLLAVQWHPENLIDRPPHLQLFTALVTAAGRAAR